MNSTQQPNWSLAYIVLILVLIIVASFVAGAFDMYQFDPVSVESILGILIPIFIIAAFLERAQEVFISAWRNMGRAPLDRKVKDLKTQMPVEPEKRSSEQMKQLEDAESKLDSYKAKTGRIAFLFSLGAGVFISLVGVRALRPLTSMDADPTGIQKTLFSFVDIFLTGALIGGGSEGVHRVANVITDFLEAARDKVKK